MSTQIQVSPQTGITIGTTPIASGVAGRILFEGAGNVVQEDAGLFWDNVNKRLGVGTSAPSALLQINGSVSASSAIARGGLVAPTLTASANNDMLVGLDITPTFTNGAFTGVKNYGIRYLGFNVDNTSTINSTGNVVISGDLYASAARVQYLGASSGINYARLFPTTGNLMLQNGGTFTDSGAKLHIAAQGALSTDIAFRVRNSADTFDRLNLTGTAFSITTVNRAEMSVTANAVNFGLDNHNVVFTHSSAGQVLQTQRSAQLAYGHLATLGLADVETLTSGSTILGATIRTGVLTNVQNKMHFVCDKEKWGNGGIYSAGFQWFKGTQSGDAAFGTSVLPSITTANRQMWLTPESSLLLFNTTGITYTTNTDSFQQYSADITAGNAAPHFRTENGAVVKLYQETTAVTAATFVANTGNYLREDSTFDGYTMKQVVKALRNMGILA